MAKLLTFVEKSNPILRETMNPITNFKDKNLQETLSDMRFSIHPKQLKAANGAHDNAAGMAANQWGIRLRAFIYSPYGSESPKNLKVMLNPSYKPHLRENETEPKITAAYEGCFSVPLTTGAVHRYDAIVATYYTPDGEKQEEILEGWEARVFQHETDHLDGKLFDGALDNFKGPVCQNRIIFKDKEEMAAFWDKMSADNTDEK